MVQEKLEQLELRVAPEKLSLLVQLEAQVRADKLVLPVLAALRVKQGTQGRLSIQAQLVARVLVAIQDSAILKTP